MRAWLVLLTIQITAGVALAAPATPRDTTDYSGRVWQTLDGLPEDFAQALAQTADGYLWVGTSGGLVRFDGVHFVTFNRANQPAFKDESVYSLYRAKDGALWAGTEGGGLIRYRNGEFRCFGAADGLTNGFVRVIYEDRQNRFWVGTDAGLFSKRGDSFERVDGKNGLPAMNVHSIHEDRQGRLLVGGWGLLILDRQSASYYKSSEDLADNSIRAIRETSDGAVWIGTISGLRRIEGGLRADPFLTPRLISNTNISVLHESRTGQLWIGTYGRGVMLYHDNKLVRFSAPSRLPHNNVLSVFEDTEDDVWIGTQGGLLRLRPCAAYTITTPDDAPVSINTIYQDPLGPLFVAALNGQLFEIRDGRLATPRLPSSVRELPVRNVFRDRRGTLWIGTDGEGVIKLDGARVTRYTMKQGLINDFVRAFCEDREGGLWIGTDGGLSHWRDGAFRNFDIETGLAYRSIRALLLDRAGSLWVATDGGLSRFKGGSFVTDPLAARLRGQKIWALYEDPDGGIWIGTQGAGLFLLKGGTLAGFTTREGLPSNKIYFITGDASGALWMSGPAGIVSASRREMENLAREGSGRLAVRLYGYVSRVLQKGSWCFPRMMVDENLKGGERP